MSKAQACGTEQGSLSRPDPRKHILHKTVWENHSVLTHGECRNDLKYLAGRRVIKEKGCFPCQWLSCKKNSWHHLLYFYFLKDLLGNLSSLNHAIFVHLLNEGKRHVSRMAANSEWQNLIITISIMFLN